MWRCASCGEVVERLAAVLSRGSLWHRPCARMVGDMVDFPSSGRLYPETVLVVEGAARYAVCRHGRRITVKRVDLDHDFGEVLAECATLGEAREKAARLRKGVERP